MIIRLFFLATCILLSACTNILHKKAPVPPVLKKELPIMNTQESFRPHTITEYPHLTAEEMGRRFLLLAKGIQSGNDMTMQHVNEIMGIPLAYLPESKSYAFTIHSNQSGWGYGFDYLPYTAAQGGGSRLSLYISNLENPSDIESYACISFDQYINSFKDAGFLVTPEYNEIGLAEAWNISKFSPNALSDSKPLITGNLADLRRSLASKNEKAACLSNIVLYVGTGA
jgi:hypothetical protein